MLTFYEWLMREKDRHGVPWDQKELHYALRSEYAEYYTSEADKDSQDSTEEMNLYFAGEALNNER